VDLGCVCHVPLHVGLPKAFVEQHVTLPGHQNGAHKGLREEQRLGKRGSLKGLFQVELKSLDNDLESLSE